MANNTPNPVFKDVKALLFDVFGTVVNWRIASTRELHEKAIEACEQAETRNIPDAVRNKASNMTPQDWLDVAEAWRKCYYRYTRSVAADPTIPVKTIDELYYDSLLDLIRENQLEGLWSQEEIKELSFVWHRLDPWPDSVQGISLLNTRFSTSTLSNGNVSLLEDMAKYGQLPWTHILSSEMFNSFKPNPKVYLGAAERLGLQPAQCAMVAAHLSDLEAAKKCGLHTVYVERHLEEAWDSEQIQQARNSGFVDEWVTLDKRGFLEVAEKLGCS